MPCSTTLKKNPSVTSQVTVKQQTPTNIIYIKTEDLAFDRSCLEALHVKFSSVRLSSPLCTQSILISNPGNSPVSPKYARNLQKHLWSLIFWTKTKDRNFFYMFPCLYTIPIVDDVFCLKLRVWLFLAAIGWVLWMKGKDSGKADLKQNTQ